MASEYTLPVLLVILSLFHGTFGRGVKGWDDSYLQNNDIVDYTLPDYPSLPNDISDDLDKDLIVPYGGSDYDYNLDPTYNPDLGEGIFPAGSDYEVNYGVGPINGESSEETDFDWSGLFGSVKETFNDWGDKAEDGFYTLTDKAKDLAGDIDDSFDDFKKDVKAKAKSAGAVISGITLEAKDKINDAWQSTKEAVPQIWEDFKKILVNFGYEVEKGALYIKEKCEQVLNKARGSHILQRLEQKLEEGDENVAAFFTCIGKKISEWSDKSSEERDMDDGLENHHHYLQDSHYTDPGYPNILQDQEVHGHLMKLVQQNVLEQEDLQVLYQTTSSNGDQNDRLIHDWDDFKFDEDLDFGEIVQETNDD